MYCWTDSLNLILDTVSWLEWCIGPLPGMLSEASGNTFPCVLFSELSRWCWPSRDCSRQSKVSSQPTS